MRKMFVFSLLSLALAIPLTATPATPTTTEGAKAELAITYYYLPG